MWRGLPILGLVCLAAVRGGAEEPAGAPLEGTRQELKKLQTDQPNRSSSAAPGGLTDGLPQIQTPVPGAVLLEMPAADKAEKDRKKKAEARKNWLLDGVDKLGKSNGIGNQGREGPATGEAVPDDGTDQLDSSDPDYILKVYTQQKKAAGAKADQQKSTTPRGDPFAPFLQGWLETSPARGKFFDEFVRKPDAPGGMPATAPSANGHGFNPGSGGGDMADSTRSVPVAAQSNPYLQGLGAPSLPDSRVGFSLPTATSNAPTGPAPRQSAASTLEPIPASRPAEKRPPLLAPSDDKKYFPQLRKF